MLNRASHESEAILLMDLGTEIVVGLDPGAHVVNDCMPDAGTSATVLGALSKYGKLTKGDISAR